MRKNIGRAVVALLMALAMMTPIATADDMGLSGQALYDLVVSMFDQHALHHDALAETELLTSSQGENVLMRCKAPAEGNGDRLIGCIDMGYATTRNAPRNQRQAEALLDEVLTDAQVAQEADEAALYDADRLTALRGEGVNVTFATSQLWLTGQFLESDLVIAPFFLLDEDDAVVDGSHYFMMVIAGSRDSQVWVCADQDVVFDLYKAIDLDKGDEAFVTHVRDLMKGYRRQIGGELGADGEVIAEGRVGRVQVNADGNVNIRGEAGFDAPIIGKARAEERFDCFEEITLQDKSIWYEVMLDSGEFGYLPSSFAMYTAD